MDLSDTSVKEDGSKAVQKPKETEEQGDERDEISPELMVRLDHLYLTPGLPSAYGSFNALWLAAKTTPGITRRKVKLYLDSKTSQNRYRQLRKKFKRRQFVAFGVDHIWSGDLADFSNLSWYNRGVKYLLVLVDVLSSRVRLVGVKKKTGEAIAAALESVFSLASPRLLCVDRGKEFYNHNVADVLSKHHVIVYSTNNFDVKSSQSERMIRTLRKRIGRYMAENKSFRYIDHLSDFATSINNSVNRSTGMKPSSVTKSNEKVAFEKRYGRTKTKKKVRRSYQVGDVVRVAIPRISFRKEWEPSFSAALHRISEAPPTNPSVYRVERLDAKGDPIGHLEKGYYSPELSRVHAPNFNESVLPNPPKRPRVI